MKKTVFSSARVLLGFGALLGLAACASGADPTLMTVKQAPADAPFPAAFQHTMCSRTVSGGENTNPLWVSKVSDKDFQKAFSASLDAAGLSDTSSHCQYPIDVNLLGLSQPTMGLAMEVGSHVNYKVYDAAGRPILLETINASYTAEFSESLIGVTRLQRANEGAMRTSISKFFEKLRSVKTDAPASTPTS